MGMMATCDKCGKQMNERVFNGQGACLSLTYSLTFKAYTLCKGCRKAFEKWMGETAEPEIIRCKDCKWFGDFGCAIRIVDDTDKPTENDYCSFAERRNDG